MPGRTHAMLFALVVAILSGCATPIAPSGGPPDETPPEVVETNPEQGAVNVDAESMRIIFSEYINETTLPQALSLSPGFDLPLEFSWRGRSVVLRFPESLRENTTYVVTIDTNLRDANGVALRTPIILAFSTGPTVSRGVLAGRVVDWSTEDPVAGVDVLAYAIPDSAAPDSLPSRPAYRTQTDDDGAFNFAYLTEQFYFVGAIDDENRNLQPDQQEAFAPPPYPALFADSTADPPAAPWILARIDTTAPTPVRTESVSQSRHLIRFSEAVQFADRDPSAWMLADSASGETIDIESLYLQVEDLRQVFFTTRELDLGRFLVHPAALIDSSGNAVLVAPIYFTPVEHTDTLQTRFVDFFPDDLPTAEATYLARDIEPGIRFNTPIDPVILDAAVSVSDTLGSSLAYVAVTKNGTDYEILTEPRLQPGSAVSIAVDASALAGPDTVYTRNFQRISADETGEISGVVKTTGEEERGRILETATIETDETEAVVEIDVVDLEEGTDQEAMAVVEEAEEEEETEDSAEAEAEAAEEVEDTEEEAAIVPSGGADPTILVQAIPVDVSVVVPTYEVAADDEGNFLFSGLPAGEYRLRAFADENSNGRWDPGLLLPYTPGEGITWRSEPSRVRARWETAVPDTMHIYTVR